MAAGRGRLRGHGTREMGSPVPRFSCEACRAVIARAWHWPWGPVARHVARGGPSIHDRTGWWMVGRRSAVHNHLIRSERNEAQAVKACKAYFSCIIIFYRPIANRVVRARRSPARQRPRPRTPARRVSHPLDRRAARAASGPRPDDRARWALRTSQMGIRTDPIRDRRSRGYVGIPAIRRGRQVLALDLEGGIPIRSIMIKMAPARRPPRPKPGGPEHREVLHRALRVYIRHT